MLFGLAAVSVAGTGWASFRRSEPSVSQVEQPDVAICQVGADGNFSVNMGVGVINADNDAQNTWTAPQTLSETQTFRAQIRNTGKEAATFQVFLEGIAPIPGGGDWTKWEPKDWNGDASLDGDTASIWAALSSKKGWTTPRLGPDESVVLLVKIISPSLTPALATIPPTAKVAAPTASFRLVAQSQACEDSVIEQIPLQTLRAIEWSIDDKVWKPVTPDTVIPASVSQTIGIRVVPDFDEDKIVGSTWPESFSLGPRWTWQNTTYSGRDVWLYADHETDGDGQVAVMKFGPTTLAWHIHVGEGTAFFNP